MNFALWRKLQLVSDWINLLGDGEGTNVSGTYGAFPLHGTARYGSVRFTFGGFPLGTVPGTFLVPPRPRFQAIRTVTKT